MANKRIQDLEQTTDLTNDDLIPLDTTKKTFATTLKSLTEWLKGTFQTTANLEQTLSDAIDKYPSSKVLKDESSRIVSVMDSQYSNLLSTLYPVGSIYIGTQNSCPLASLIAGSQWQIVSNGRALWGGNGSNANSTIEAGLPNIIGAFIARIYGENRIGFDASGCFVGSDAGGYCNPDGGGDISGNRNRFMNFNAALSSAIYGKSNTVQPPAYIVNVWRRTA